MKETTMNIKSAKELVAAANADVATLSADAAVKLIHDPNVVFVDVRETDERRKTGNLKGAVHAPRGFLEFHADPDSPTHVKALSSGCSPSATMRQIEGLHEGRISGSS
jgi:rhodanese-related sulfurtransferase